MQLFREILPTKFGAVPAALLLVLLSLDGIVTSRLLTEAKQERRAALLHQTELVAQGLNLIRISALTGTPADLTSPEYLRVQNQLATIRTSIPNCRSLFLLGRPRQPSDGGLVYLVGSGQAERSTERNVDAAILPECLRVFSSNTAAITSSATHAGAPSATALVPIHNALQARSGSALPEEHVDFVLGLESDVRDGIRDLLRSTLPPALVTLALAGLLFFGRRLLIRRSQTSARPSFWLSHLEALLVGAAGLVLTLFAMWVGQAQAVRSLREDFRVHANARTEAVAESLRSIRRNELECLALFYEASERVSDEEFSIFTSYLKRNAAMELCAWVPRVSQAGQAAFEADLRTGGRPGFGIWEFDAQGKMRPAVGREVYFPIQQATVPAGARGLEGFDLGSQPPLRQMLDEAARTGLPSFAFSSLGRAGSPESMVFCRPVFAAGKPGSLRGFCLLAANLGQLVRGPGEGEWIALRLSLLKHDGTSEALYSGRGSGDPSAGTFTLVRPVFAFGRVFEITAEAAQRINPLQSGSGIAGTGFALTAAGIVVVTFLRQSRERLEHLVDARTRELRESESSYRNQFASNASAMLMIDPSDGSIVDANAAAQQFYGFSAERLQAMKITDINTMPAADARKVLDQVAEEKSGHFVFGHRLANGSVRTVEASVSRIQFQNRPLLHAIIHDVTEREGAVAALAKERQLLRTLIDNLPGGIYAKDLDLRKTLANLAEVYSVGRTTEDEVLGRDDFAFYSPEEAAAFQEHDRSVIEGGLPLVNVEEWFVDPQGREKWVLSSKIPLREANGRIIGLVGIWNDITERKIAEQATQKRIELDACLSRMIHSLLRGMKVGTSLSEALAILGTGLKCGRVCLFQSVSPDDGSRQMKCLEQWPEQESPPELFGSAEEASRTGGWQAPLELLANGRCHIQGDSDSADDNGSLPGGARRNESLTAPVFIEETGGRTFWGVLAFFECGSNREWEAHEMVIIEAAADLLGVFLTRLGEIEMLRLLGAAVDSAQEAFVITDAQLQAPGPHILFANPAVERLTGYPREELVGKSPRLFQGPRTNHEALQRLREDLPQGIPFHGVTTNYNKNGSPYMVDWNIAPVRNSEGVITHYVSVQRDITQQQAMEKRLALASKMESVGSLAAGIAHEINSPAQFIGDNLQFANDTICKASAAWAASALEPGVAQQLFEEVPAALQDALEGVGRIEKIVKSMREFTHPGEVMSPSDLNRCVETSVTVCRNEWKYVAEVTFDLAPELPLVPCVRSDIGQVVLNLVVNAAHAIASQKRATPGKIHLSTRVNGEWAELRIDDDGPGIPPEVADRIFDPFFTTKEVGKGTGQGLFLAQQTILGKHCGRIEVNSTPGKGASFLIQLPLNPSQDQAPDTQQ